MLSDIDPEEIPIITLKEMRRQLERARADERKKFVMEFKAPPGGGWCSIDTKAFEIMIDEVKKEAKAESLAEALKEHNHHFIRPRDEHGNLSCLLCILETKAHEQGLNSACELARADERRKSLHAIIGGSEFGHELYEMERKAYLAGQRSKTAYRLGVEEERAEREAKDIQSWLRKQTPNEMEFVKAIREQGQANPSYEAICKELYEHHGHWKSRSCPHDECMICAMIDCPHGEALHYHHDGCPACFGEEKTKLDMNKLIKSNSKTHSTFQKKINYYKKKIGVLMNKLRKINKQERIHHHIHETVKKELGKERFMAIVGEASESAAGANIIHSPPTSSAPVSPEKRRCCACGKTECEHQPVYSRKQNKPACPFCGGTDLGFAREFRLKEDGSEEPATDCSKCNRIFYMSDHDAMSELIKAAEGYAKSEPHPTYNWKKYDVCKCGHKREAHTSWCCLSDNGHDDCDCEEFEIEEKSLCRKCSKMTNHKDGKCQICNTPFAYGMEKPR